MVALFGPRRLALLEPWKFDVLASLFAGCIMVGWMTIEIALIGFGVWVQAVYFAVGMLTSALAILLQWAESRHPEQQTRARVGPRPHATA